MPEIISIGPLRLDGYLLMILISAVTGIAALAVWIRLRPGERSGPWTDVITNAALLALLGWKLGIAISEPSIIWDRPSALLVMRGGTTELIIGMALAVIYLAVLVIRGRISAWRLLEVLPFALLPGLIVWSVLKEFPYNIGYAIVWAIVYSRLLRSTVSRTAPAAGKALIRQWMLGFGIGGLLVSLFAPLAPGEWLDLTLGLTKLQWVLLVFAAAGALIQSKPQTAAQAGSAAQAESAAQAGTGSASQAGLTGQVNSAANFGSAGEANSAAEANDDD